MEKSVSKQLGEMDQELFEHHAGAKLPLSWFVLPFYLVYPMVALGEYCYRTWLEPPLDATEVIEDESADDGAPAEPSPKRAAGWFFPFLLGLLTLGLYVLLADHLSGSHGGYLKMRLALLPPLLWLACLREPFNLPMRLILRWLMALLIGVNLLLVMQTMAGWNNVLEQYTAGIPAVGRGHRFQAMQTGGGGRLVNPLLHAGDYYCLGTDNINLDNYEAGTTHFPIKYRPGAGRGRAQDADTLIYFRAGPVAARPGWKELFVHGPLRIFRRTEI